MWNNIDSLSIYNTFTSFYKIVQEVDFVPVYLECMTIWNRVGQILFKVVNNQIYSLKKLA